MMFAQIVERATAVHGENGSNGEVFTIPLQKVGNFPVYSYLWRLACEMEAV